MAKRQPATPLRQRVPWAPEKKGPVIALNSAVNRQVRKLLGKHYRAKYGVK